MARKPSDTKMFRVSLPKTLIDAVDNQHWGERREIKDIVAEALKDYLKTHPVPSAPSAA